MVGVRRAALQIRPVSHEKSEVGLQKELLAVDIAADCLAGGPGVGASAAPAPAPLAVTTVLAVTASSASTTAAAPGAPPTTSANDCFALSRAEVEEEVGADASLVAVLRGAHRLNLFGVSFWSSALVLISLVSLVSLLLLLLLTSLWPRSRLRAVPISQPPTAATAAAAVASASARAASPDAVASAWASAWASSTRRGCCGR